MKFSCRRSPVNSQATLFSFDFWSNFSIIIEGWSLIDHSSMISPIKECRFPQSLKIPYQVPLGQWRPYWMFSKCFEKISIKNLYIRSFVWVYFKCYRFVTLFSLCSSCSISSIVNRSAKNAAILSNLFERVVRRRCHWQNALQICLSNMSLRLQYFQKGEIFSRLATALVETALTT